LPGDPILGEHEGRNINSYGLDSAAQKPLQLQL
jgi:hypothetical protein